VLAASMGRCPQHSADDQFRGRGPGLPCGGDTGQSNSLARRSLTAPRNTLPSGIQGTKGGCLQYQRPSVIDFGSIADHTFSRCNPDVTGTPIKDTIDVPHHIDNHLECSALS
jgi:hypothetical protein